MAGDVSWVGFSRLRPTRFRRNVSWVKHGFRRVGRHRSGPTRLAAYSLEDARLLDEIDLEPHGLNAVFSILPAATDTRDDDRAGRPDAGARDP